MRRRVLHCAIGADLLVAVCTRYWDNTVLHSGATVSRRQHEKDKNTNANGVRHGTANAGPRCWLRPWIRFASHVHRSLEDASDQQQRSTLDGCLVVRLGSAGNHNVRLFLDDRNVPEGIAKNAAVASRIRDT